MIAFYCVFALVLILFGIKSYIGYRRTMERDPWEEIYGKEFDMPNPYSRDPFLASDAIPFWRYHECNGKSRRKRCKIAFYKFKAKLKRRKK